jgi:hypothetical protein
LESESKKIQFPLSHFMGKVPHAADLAPVCMQFLYIPVFPDMADHFFSLLRRLVHFLPAGRTNRIHGPEFRRFVGHIVQKKEKPGYYFVAAPHFVRQGNSITPRSPSQNPNYYPLSTFYYHCCFLCSSVISPLFVSGAPFL